MGEEEEEPEPLPQTGRKSGDSNSPEFEFWSPSCPPPNLLSADELFAGGFVLPLHSLNHSDEPPPPPPPPGIAESRSDDSETSAADLSTSPSLTSSKRWMNIFRKSDKKMSRTSEKLVNDTISKVKKKRDKKNGTVVAGSAELNINIWPFSRSRSAGTGGARLRSAVAIRKVSSAPCSRSNSAGESKSRKWPSSPGRTGIHVGRTSPVWQVRRGGSGRRPDAFFNNNAQKRIVKEVNQGRRRSPVAKVSALGGKSKVLTLNIPMCIGYRQHTSCGNDENNTACGDISGDGVRGNHLFNIWSLFSKKVY